MTRVLVEREGAVARVRLNRPEKRNGLDLPMFEAIVAAGQALRDDTSVRAVVLSGEGPSFCAGLDFKSFMSTPDAPQRLLGGRTHVANLAQRVAWIWRELPMPVIAAVHGHCFGGGLQIALGADIRLCAPDARFSVMEIEYGLIPDMSASKTLLPLVRLDVAKELTFTGRVVDADEAVAIGLATRKVEDATASALEMAEAIARRSPHAIRGIKKLYDAAAALSDVDALTLESELQIPLLGSRNQLEAVSAKLGGRPPSFVDPE